MLAHVTRPRHRLLPPPGCAWMCRSIMVGVVFGLAATPAAAQYGATARVEGGQQPEEAAAAPATLEPESRQLGEFSVAEMLSEVPGVRVLSAGPASNSGLSIHGAGTEHTEYYLEDLPLGSDSIGAPSLQLFSPWLFGSLEVFRGSVAADLAAAPIGGAVRLTPPKNLGLMRAALGLGTYGLFESHLGSQVHFRNGQWLAAAALGGAQNNYPYFDDGGTTFVKTDDTERRRQNAEDLHASLLSRLVVDFGDSELAALIWLTRVASSVPGPAAQPTQFTRKYETRGWASVQWSGVPIAEQKHTLRIGAAVGIASQRFSDLYGELGYGRAQTNNLALDALLYGSWHRRWLPWLETKTTLRLRSESYLPSSMFAIVPPEDSQRQAGVMGVYTRVHGRAPLRWEASVDATMQGVHSAIADPRPESAGTQINNWQAIPNIRAGAQLSVSRAFKVGIAGRTASRVPTVFELFGDGVFVRGNAELQQERGFGADVWVSGASVGDFALSYELRAHWLRLEELIRYVRTSQFFLVPQNIDTGTAWGVDVGGTAQWKGLALTASASYLDARDDTRRFLPLRPRWSGFGRLLWALGDKQADLPVAFALFTELQYIGANYVDSPNLVELDARVRWALGGSLAVKAARTSLQCRLDDVLDTRGYDLVGFPLPGRAFRCLLGAAL